MSLMTYVPYSNVKPVADLSATRKLGLVAKVTKRIARKKGQHRGSSSHSDLYTDENPKGTIHGLKFATVQDAKDSVKKIESSGKSHAHKIQAAIAMEQRARVMGKTGPADVYRAYIEKMKKITKQRNESRGYFTKTKSQSSKGKKLVSVVGPDIKKKLKGINYKIEPDSTGTQIILTVDKSDVEKVKKLVGLPNMVKVVSEDFTQKDVNDLEKFADRILKKYDIDVEFTRHFVDRLNDPRNSPEIKVSELQRFFKKIQRNKGKNIRNNPDIEAVLKDMSTNLNLPVVIKTKGDSFEVTNKTIMRKPDFKTTSKVIKYEDVRRMPDGKWGVYADKFVKGKRVMTPGGKHAKELKKVYDNEKDANDYMAAIMIAKGGG